MKDRIVSLYGDGILKKSAISIRDGYGVLESIFADGYFSNILEIGTYKGIGAACLSQWCEKVFTVDLIQGRMENNQENFDREEFWDSLGCKNIDLFLVKDNIEKSSLIQTLDFDIAFIDGGKDDIAEDFEMVKHCGHVLFHDYDDRGQPALNKVYDFVNSLPKEKVTITDIFALWTA